MTFKDIFPGLSSFNFQDFPGPKSFSRTFQVLEFSREKSRTFQETWEPCMWSLHGGFIQTVHEEHYNCDIHRHKETDGQCCDKSGPRYHGALP